MTPARSNQGTPPTAPALIANPAEMSADQFILPVVLIFWIFFFCYTEIRYQPPAPLPQDARAQLFSASRAEPILEMLAGDALPRNAGSPQNQFVRQRIVEFLEAAGYAVQIQTGVGTVNPLVRDRSPDQETVPLANILTRLKGESSDSAILLAAHYDSVPFGPGACDDGVGCAAVLEIARMLGEEPPPPRDVIFLLTDGEELGMLGATLFVEEHAWARDVEVAINLEARGTSGPSCLFETSRDSRWLVPVFARASRKPISSSLFFEIYQRLPNDTDFSVFQDAQMEGYNFAFVGDVKNYHTSADNLANANRGSLQHHGENSLSLIRELGKTPIPPHPAGRVVYFDLYGWCLFWWPESWSLGLVFLAAFMFGGGLYLHRWWRNEEPPATSNLPGFALSMLSVMLAFSLVFGLGWLLVQLCELDPRLKNLWPEQPVPYAVAFWLAAFALLCFLSMTLFFSQSLPAVASSVIAFWLLLGFVVSIGVAGASHLFVVPTLGVAAVGIFIVWSANGWKWLALLFPIMVGLMWLSLERVFYDGVGFRMPNLMLVRVAMVTSALLPAMKCTSQESLFRWSLTGAAAAVLAFFLAVLLNPTR